jgi:hypothetical protein
MPKRVVDGEGVWGSDRLRKVFPSRIRAEYTNLIPLALANGVFEANPVKVWSKVYSYNRPDIKKRKVAGILNAFERAGMLFRWKNGDGKVWGYWIRIEKSGRLPGKSRWGRNESIGPFPPLEKLRKFLDSKCIPWDTSLDSISCLGSGSGFCSGSGTGGRGSHDVPKLKDVRPDRR